ncbi:MAG: hypothetical protein JWM81_19 [Candidatus Saccharibacteria bacterium]|nr:hypothetical protein [Candidatus Saccharibacteria bacterium]
MSERDRSFEEVTGAQPVLFAVEELLGERGIAPADIQQAHSWAVAEARTVCNDGVIATRRGSIEYTSSMSPARTYTARNGRQVQLRLLISRGLEHLGDRDEVDLVQLAVEKEEQVLPDITLSPTYIGNLNHSSGNPAHLDMMIKAVKWFTSAQPEAGADTPRQSLVEADPSTTFSDYMRSILYQLRAKRVVEVGPDVQYRDAMDLSNACENYTMVSTPEFIEYAAGNFELAKDMGGMRAELIAGNATKLSTLVPPADLVLMKNVQLELGPGDTARWAADRRGEIVLTAEDRVALLERFERAKLLGLKEALFVAQDGCLVTFHRKQTSDDIYGVLTEDLGVPMHNVRRQSLRYDDKGSNNEAWEMLIVDNRKLS